MTPARAVLAERVVLGAGIAALGVGLAGFDPRFALIVLGTIAILSALDLPWRRP